jgi:dienelactone hydrolase
MTTRVLLAAAIVAATVSTVDAQPFERRLWPGGAPGSESWKLTETTSVGPSGDRTITNVVDPTLTVYLPDEARATGTAVIIAPGGGLRALAWDNEGTRAAEWLTSRGIAAFVLKYRTLQVAPSPGQGAGRGGPPPGAGAAPAGGRQEMTIRNGNANPAPDNAGLSELLRLAISDAQQAVRTVRANAAEWRVDPARVGLMGFSAGGGVGIGAALADQRDASPDFLISVYGPSLQDVVVPEHAPPLFIAVGNTHFNVTNGCLALFAEWKAAGKPAELHIYDQISGPFGMTPRGLPVDSWTERLHEWMVARGITK